MIRFKGEISCDHQEFDPVKNSYKTCDRVADVDLMLQSSSVSLVEVYLMPDSWDEWHDGKHRCPSHKDHDDFAH
jgi:hypothetical protein